MAGDLSSVAGIPPEDVPLCIESIWTDGAGSLDSDVACKALVCIIRLFQHAGHSKGATEAIIDANIADIPGLASLDPALVKAEIDRLYSNPSIESLCQLIKGCELSDRCEGEYCLFPQSEYAKNKTVEGPSGLEIIEQIKSDPRSLKDLAILNSLADLRCDDPIEFDLLIEAIKKANVGIKVATIIDLVDKRVQEKAKAAQQAAPKTPEDVQGKALAIAERGDSLKYLIWQAQRNHLGDIDYQKVLIASIASAASQTSNGIQPGGNGDKGSGKSDACTATYHLVPLDRRLDGSLSPMSLFYLQETGRLKPGMVLFSDDVEYEPIIPIYKRATARFQHGITHFTVSGGKTREALELIIPPRMVWWLTSVESVANEQAFDRQYPISTDSSPDHKKRVAREIAARRARKELKLDEDEGIEVARAIIADIFDNGPFKVLIPQSEKAEWLKVSDFRGQEQFWDLVDALVILRWRKHQRDEDGWLIAEDQDLIEAKDILTGHKVAHFADLTEAEEKVVGVMSSGLPMTQKDLTEALGVAQSTLSARLASIMAKSAIITEDVFQGKKIYSLNPKMNLGSTYWAGIDLVKLNINTDEAYRSQQIALSGCYRYLIGVPIGIIINNSNRIPSSLSVNLKGSIERDTSSCEKCLGIPSSILFPDKSTDNPQNKQQEPLSDTDKSPDNQTDKTDKAISRPIDIPIRQSSAIIGDGPSMSKRDMPTPVSEHVNFVVVRFLAAIPAFAGIDGRTYGPFVVDDVASIPEIHAIALFRKDVIVSVNCSGAHPLRDAPVSQDGEVGV